MANGSDNVFADIERDIQYEHLINEARSYLAAGNNDLAIKTAEEARNYLKPGASSADIDAIQAAAKGSTEQAARDREEQKARAEAEAKRQKEAERLAQQQAEEAERQKQREEAQRKEEAQTKAKARQKFLHKFSTAVFWLFAAFLVAKVAVFGDYFVGWTWPQILSVLLIPVFWAYYSGTQKPFSNAPVVLSLLMFAGYMYLVGRMTLYTGAFWEDPVMAFLANTLTVDELFPFKLAGVGAVIAGAIAWVARELGKGSKQAKTGVASVVVVTVLLLVPLVLAGISFVLSHYGYLF